MPRWLILAATHIAAAAAGFAGGIYMLPILTAPVSPTEAVLRSSTPEALYSGRLVRDLAGSDLLHWGEGEVRVLPLWPAAGFVDTEIGCFMKPEVAYAATTVWA